MTFNNDDGDGLAALFGGITPQRPQRAEPQPAEAPQGSPAQSSASQPAVPQPPESQAPVSHAPGAQPPDPQADAPYPVPLSRRAAREAAARQAAGEGVAPVAAPPPGQAAEPAPGQAAEPAPVRPDPAQISPHTVASEPADYWPTAPPPFAAPPESASFGSAPPAPTPAYSSPANPSPDYLSLQDSAPQYSSSQYSSSSHSSPQYSGPVDPVEPITVPDPFAAPPSAPQPSAPQRASTSFDMPAPPSQPPSYDLPPPAATPTTPVAPSASASASGPVSADVPEPLAEPPVFDGFDVLGMRPPEPEPAAASSGAPGFGDPSEHGVPSEPRSIGADADLDLDLDADLVAVPSRAEQRLVRTVVAEPPAGLVRAEPLLPDADVVIEPPEVLERPTLLEKIGLPAAVVGGPLGLIFVIVTAVLGLRRRGWLIRITRASIVLGVLSTIAAGAGGVALWELRQQQLQHDAIAAASADFCAAAAEDPALAAPPTLGWPEPAATIGESLTLMEAWTLRWTELAATSPDELRDGMELVAARGQTVVDAVTAARIIDDEANRTQIEGAVNQSGIADWHVRYCVEP